MEVVHTSASGVEHKHLFHMQLFIFEGKDSLGCAVGGRSQKILGRKNRHHDMVTPKKLFGIF
jgi:hypothetical protein